MRPIESAVSKYMLNPFCDDRIVLNYNSDTMLWNDGQQILADLSTLQTTTFPTFTKLFFCACSIKQSIRTQNISNNM